MDLAPFPHQGPLDPPQVGGRDDLLDVLVGNTPTLLILDEFSSAMDAGSAVALLRTKLQRHYREIGTRS